MALHTIAVPQKVADGRVGLNISTQSAAAIDQEIPEPAATILTAGKNPDPAPTR